MFSYIDEETTALFVLIQVYNPTYNVFARLETATVFPLSGSVYNDFNVKGGYLVMNVDKQHKPAQQLSTSFVLVIFMVMESLLWIYEMYEGKGEKRTKILDCCCAPVRYACCAHLSFIVVVGLFDGVAKQDLYR